MEAAPPNAPCSPYLLRRPPWAVPGQGRCSPSVTPSDVIVRHSYLTMVTATFQPGVATRHPTCL